MSRSPGFHHSAEARANMSAARTGKPHPHVGRPLSEEARLKISAAKRGQRPTPEQRARMAAAGKGKPKSPEHRAKIGDAVRGVPKPPSVSAKLRGNRNLLDAPVKGECAYCLGPATTHDHVIPRGRPGWGNADNVVLACHSCNASKGSRTPEEWFADATP